MKELVRIPAKVGDRILNVLSRDRRALVVRGRNGGLSVHSLGRYLAKSARMREAIRDVKPWLARRKSPLGPIGTKPLGVKGSLSRAVIYEGR